jgi:hypothetical protein
MEPYFKRWESLWKLTTGFTAHPSKGYALHAYRNGKHVHNTLDHLRSFTLIMLEVCKKVPEKNHRMWTWWYTLTIGKYPTEKHLNDRATYRMKRIKNTRTATDNPTLPMKVATPFNRTCSTAQHNFNSLTDCKHTKASWWALYQLTNNTRTLVDATASIKWLPLHRSLNLFFN